MTIFERVTGRRTPITAVLITVVSSVLATAAWAEPAVEALRATVRLTDGQNGGTGFIVASDKKEGTNQLLLVTAAHVLKKMSSPTCTLVLRACSEKGEFVRKEMPLTLRDGEKPRWVNHPEMDVAVMAVTLSKDIALQPFGAEQIATSAFAEDGRLHVGQDVFIPCFPAKTEANAAGWPILRKGMVATYPLHPLNKAKTFFVDYSHFGGDSGSPVVGWIDKKPIVVGLVISMQRQEDRVTTPFEEKTVYMPLGLAVAVQAPFIRETIDLWFKQNVSP